MSMLAQDRAQRLLAALSRQSDCQQGFGSMSPSIHDTAWLSMIQAPSGDWLFPECFDFILTQQRSSGAWDSDATPADAILNTASALLALKHRLQTVPKHDELLSRSERAEEALREKLIKWDMDTTDQVGYELLITSLLSLIEERHAISLDFPNRDALCAVRNAKLSKLPVSKLYEAPSTLHHSLEALVGVADFDRLRPLRDANGSFMSSPASTAAYLMNCSVWDDMAEAYLHKVVKRGNDSGRQGVPCAWPTTIFELSWVVTTIASVGLPIGGPTTSTISNLLRDSLAEQQDLVGFGEKKTLSPHYVQSTPQSGIANYALLFSLSHPPPDKATNTLPDADDTAKTLEALHYLGQTASVSSMLDVYDSGEHFATYPGERNVSFTTNCHILIVLLTRDDRSQHISQVAKVSQFLTNQVFREQVQEKWHLSELYWTMLFARALELLFRHEEIALAVLHLKPCLRESMPIVSLHMLAKMLRTQRHNGSWDGICEVTSYGIMATSSLATLPWMQQLDQDKMVASLTAAQFFLAKNEVDWDKGHRLWVEKVTFSCDTLSEAYCIAASCIRLPTASCSAEGSDEGIGFLRPSSFSISETELFGMKRAAALVKRVPLLASLEPWALEIAVLHACFAKRALEKQPAATTIFPQARTGKEKYLYIIPLALTATAELNGSAVSPWVLQEMMILSVLNFHADEYMEKTTETHGATALEEVRNLVKSLFLSHDPNVEAPIGGSQWTQGEASQLPTGSSLMRSTGVVLQSFVSHVMRHSAVVSSPAPLQAQLAFELRAFLLAHITHAQDNYLFRTEQHSFGGAMTNAQHDVGLRNGSEAHKQFREPGRTFYHWVHSTSADNTSCPFSFVFFNCLIYQFLPRRSGSAFKGVLSSARTAYLAEDACRRLASLCRMYNDLGSVARDADEQSVNSVNFPEFCLSSSQEAGHVPKSELLWIAEYERKGIDMAMTLLEAQVGPASATASALRLFIDVTDLYGQIYVLQDIGVRTLS